jgi:hypothetical protein
MLVLELTDFAVLAARSRCCLNRERRAETLKALRPLCERWGTLSVSRVDETTAVDPDREETSRVLTAVREMAVTGVISPDAAEVVAMCRIFLTGVSAASMTAGEASGLVAGMSERRCSESA